MLPVQVFISFAYADREIAEQLLAELQAAGFQVWSPANDILPGDNWALETGKALEQAEILVALFSKHAKDSPHVRQEVQYALTSGNYRGRVIPVLLDYTTFEVGTDVPWVLLRMDPLYLRSSPLDVGQVVERVKRAAEAGFHASA